MKDSDVLKNSTIMNIFSRHLRIDLRWRVLWNWLISHLFSYCTSMLHSIHVNVGLSSCLGGMGVGGGVLINQFVTPTFCLYFTFSGINFRDMLHHVCDMAYDENMSRPIRTRKCRSSNWLINYMLGFSQISRVQNFFITHSNKNSFWNFIFNLITRIKKGLSVN